MISRRQFLRGAGGVGLSALFACRDWPYPAEPLSPESSKYIFGGVSDLQQSVFEVITSIGYDVRGRDLIVPGFGWQFLIEEIHGLRGNWRIDVNGAWFGNGQYASTKILLPGDSWGCWLA